MHVFAPGVRSLKLAVCFSFCGSLKARSAFVEVRLVSASCYGVCRIMLKWKQLQEYKSANKDRALGAV